MKKLYLMTLSHTKPIFYRSIGCRAADKYLKDKDLYECLKLVQDNCNLDLELCSGRFILKKDYSDAYVPVPKDIYLKDDYAYEAYLPQKIADEWYLEGYNPKKSSDFLFGGKAFWEDYLKSVRQNKHVLKFVDNNEEPNEVSNEVSIKKNKVTHSMELLSDYVYACIVSVDSEKFACCELDIVEQNLSKNSFFASKSNKKNNSKSVGSIKILDIPQELSSHPLFAALCASGSYKSSISIKLDVKIEDDEVTLQKIVYPFSTLPEKSNFDKAIIRIVPYKDYKRSFVSPRNFLQVWPEGSVLYLNATDMK